jgi:hypothetical protein
VRLWTLHPKYLDPSGLTALWREALLAQAVLRGRTKGYRSHPQLTRFRGHPDPLAAISSFLLGVHAEAVCRGYRFDLSKVVEPAASVTVEETKGQLLWEWQHLLKKLSARSPDLYARAAGIEVPVPHPMFRIVEGPVRFWERGAKRGRE